MELVSDITFYFEYVIFLIISVNLSMLQDSIAIKKN